MITRTYLPFVWIGSPTLPPQASVSPPLGPKGGRRNTSLWVRGWADPTPTTGKKAWDSLYSTAIATALINSNPGGYKKRTSPGGIMFISASTYFRGEGVREWTVGTYSSMWRFYFYEIIWSMRLFLMQRSMHSNIEMFVLWKCEDTTFKLQSPSSRFLFRPKGWKSI